MPAGLLARLLFCKDHQYRVQPHTQRWVLERRDAGCDMSAGDS